MTFPAAWSLERCRQWLHPQFSENVTKIKFMSFCSQTTGFPRTRSHLYSCRVPRVWEVVNTGQCFWIHKWLSEWTLCRMLVRAWCPCVRVSVSCLLKAELPCAFYFWKVLKRWGCGWLKSSSHVSWIIIRSESPSYIFSPNEGDLWKYILFREREREII